MIKFDEITVTFHPSSEIDPIIVIKMNIQLAIHAIIHKGLLKTRKSTINIKMKAPMPKIIISFFTNAIVSFAIIETPPR
tara:strand:+ start:424 stop:660 length:237 start_codon:yes stop_codon:yes gene_type:complete